MRHLAGHKMPLQRVSEIMDVDDNAFDAGFSQAVERVIDQRLAVDLNQRLGDVADVGAHARSESGRQHDRAVWCHERSGPAAALPLIRAIIIKIPRAPARWPRTTHEAERGRDAPASAAGSAISAEYVAGIAVFRHAG